MKKAFVIILCVILLASFTLQSAPAHAIAPGLMITGSTIINSAAMSAILSIVAQTMGLDGNIKQGMEAAQQNALTVYLGGLLSEYATRVGSTVGAFYTIINEGMKYASNGALTFDDAASQFLGDFFEWVHSEDGANLQQYDDISSGSSGVVTPDTSSACYFTSSNPYVYQSITYSGTRKPGGAFVNPSFTAFGNDPVYFILYYDGSSYTVCGYSKSAFTYSYPNSTGASYNTGNCTYHVYNGQMIYYYTGNIYPSNFYDMQTVENAGTYNTNVSTGFNALPIGYAILYGGTIAGESNVDTNIFDFPENEPNYDTNVIYPGDIISMPDFGSGSTGTADIGSYLGAVSDVIYSGAGSLSVEDSQGVTTDYSVSSSGVESMQHVQAASATLDQTVGGTTTAVGSGTVSGELSAYTLDLRDFFPFCIPFDIYRMLSIFAASREAPHVEWRFLVPGIVDQTIEIDLSVFDNVAATLRSVELIAAAIGLALITKRLIQGGD